MKQMTRLEKFGLAATLVVVLTYFYMRFIYEPQEARYKKTIQNYNKVVGEYNQLDATPSFAQIKAEIRDRKKNLEELKKTLSASAVKTGAEEEITELVGQISEVMTDSGLTLVKITPEGPDPDDLFEWQKFSVSAAGPFRCILRFLEMLKGMPDAMKLGNISIIPPDNPENGVMFSFSIHL